MYDLSMVNSRPGKCCKCGGKGVYSMGSKVNGRPAKTGMCYSCRGTGYQDAAQIKRNQAYNRWKASQITAC